jgi:phage N-6-adenine-methyltransferase
MPVQKPHRSKQNYATPANFIGAAKRRLRIDAFSFDFAAEAENTKAPQYWTEQIDSLSQSAETWVAAAAGGWGWLNPPFEKIGPWAKRCMETRMRGGKIAFLVPAGVGADWFADYVDGHALVLMLNGRLCFIDDWQHTIDPATQKPGKGPERCYLSAPLYPKDCILCLYSQTIKPGYEVWDWRRDIPKELVA